MDGREIPGFYFDREKGKYFRILSGSKAPQDYKYSKENIKKQQREDYIEKKKDRYNKRKKKERISAPYKSNRLLQAYLDREIGHSRRSSYLQNVWPGACASGFEATVMALPDSIRYFDYNATCKYMYTNVGEYDLEREYPEDAALATDERILIRLSTDAAYRERLLRKTIARMTSPVTSLNYLSASGALAVTTKGSDRPPVVYLTDPERDGPYVGEQFTPRHCSTIWTSCPRPNFSVSESGTSIPANSAEHLAVGAASNLQLYTRPPSGLWECKTALKCDSDVLALTWLSPTTIVLGHRDGKIRIYDIRSEGATHILSHSAPITQLRPADDFTRIVCAGICDTLIMYDMRTAEAVTEPLRKKRKKRIDGSLHVPFRSSRPLTRYEYKNSDTPDLGMDVHPRLGLIAAADEENNIHVWNMYKQELVNTFTSNAWMSGPESGKRPRTAEERIRCVRFVEDVGSGDVSLWTNVNGGVTKFGW